MPRVYIVPITETHFFLGERGALIWRGHLLPYLNHVGSDLHVIIYCSKVTLKEKVQEKGWASISPHGHSNVLFLC